METKLKQRVNCFNRSKKRCSSVTAYINGEVVSEGRHSHACRSYTYQEKKKYDLCKKILNDILDQEEVSKPEVVYTLKCNLEDSDDHSAHYCNNFRDLEERVKLYSNRYNHKEEVIRAIEHACTHLSAELVYYIDEIANNQDGIIKIYKEVFDNLNAKMDEWVRTYKSYSCYFNGKLAGAITVDIFTSCDGIKFTNILLIGVLKSHQGQGIGIDLIEFARKSCDAMCVYSDPSSVEFYKNRGFKLNKSKLRELYNDVLYEKNAYFMTLDFKKIK
jgi:GNAT superfamily N-acetyltransferase